MKDFIELQGRSGSIWVRVDKIVAIWPHKFRYMDASGYHDANGTKLLMQLDSEGCDVFERPSEVMAKIEAAHASQS